MITTIINKEISIFDKFGKIAATYQNGILIESNLQQRMNDKFLTTL